MRASHLLKTAAAVSVVLFTTTVFSVPAQANDEFYQVINVRADDSLNIRAGASVQQPVIGTIPSNGRTILSTGRTQQVGNSTWIEIVWLGQIGWVNSTYLSNDAAPVVQVQPERKKPAQINYQYQQSDPEPMTNNAETHTHPANRCTRSVTHAHPTNNSAHEHRYSCQRGQQVQPKQRQVMQDANSHSHPANRCTRSVTHSHPTTSSSSHEHRYSCQESRQVQSQQRQPATQMHSHPANRCTNSVTHDHANGNNAHDHRYSCQAQEMARPKYNPQPKYNQY